MDHLRASYQVGHETVKTTKSGHYSAFGKNPGIITAAKSNEPKTVNVRNLKNSNRKINELFVSFRPKVQKTRSYFWQLHWNPRQTNYLTYGCNRRPLLMRIFTKDRRRQLHRWLEMPGEILITKKLGTNPPIKLYTAQWNIKRQNINPETSSQTLRNSITAPHFLSKFYYPRSQIIITSWTYQIFKKQWYSITWGNVKSHKY